MLNPHDIDDSQVSKRFRLEHYPAFKLLIIVAIGMLIFHYIIISKWIIVGLIVALLISIFAKLNQIISYVLAGFLLAGLISIRLDYTQIKYSDQVLPEMPGTFIGKIDNILKKTDKSIRIKASGNIDTKELPEHQNAGIIIDISKLNNKSNKLTAGNLIYAPVKARLPRTKILPTDFDEKFYAQYNNVQWFARTQGKDISILNDERNLQSFASDIASVLSIKIDSLFRNEYQGIIKAMLLGDMTDINNETRQIFSLTGTAHVLSVSGLHVGIISGIVVLLLGGIEDRKIKFGIFTVLMFGYALLTGFSPSVVRSGIMAVTVYLIYAIERQPKSLNVLSFAVLMMVLLNPAIIYSPAFQMSVASVFGIIIFYPIFRKNLSLMIKSKSVIISYIVNSLSVTFAASLMVSPIVAYYFKVFSIISPIANLLVIPLLSLAMIFAIITVILAFIYFPLALWYANSANILVNLSMEINRIAVEIPYSYLSNNNVLIVSILISLAMLYLFSANNRSKLVFRLSTISILATIMMISNKPYSESTNLKIYPLQNVVVAEIPISPNKSFIYIADRKNKQYPSLDYSLFKYLSTLNKELTIAVTGNVGMATNDKLKKIKKVRAIELSFNEQYAIENALNLKTRLPQIISQEEN